MPTQVMQNPKGLQEHSNSGAADFLQHRCPTNTWKH